ncbi:MAG: HAMP domain-containing protein [Deltaproteobacteria bacterium]|nr:HAMP domain-containing protein [Deltaproteobacteria bacterium]
MKLGLNVKFICYTVFIVVFISIVFSVVFIYRSKSALQHEFIRRAESLVQTFALNIEVPLLIENDATLKTLAFNLLQERDVQRIVIFNHQHDIMVTLDKGRRLWPWQKELIRAPVYFSPEHEGGITEDLNPFFGDADAVQDESSFQQGQAIGNVEVLFSRESIIRTLNHIRWWIFLAASLAVVIGAIAGWYFSHSLIMPIQRLAGATYSIARGNWEEQLTVRRSDELGKLTESFNIMSQSLIKKKEQLESTYKELAQKDRMAEIGKFSMIIAHELKNPLGIIKGSVDILAKQGNAPEIKTTMVEYIQDEVQRLNKLINDFLAFAKPMPPKKTEQDPNAIIRRIADHFSLPDDLDKTISLKVSAGSLPQIAIDENQITQALLNLLNNAVQAIEQKGEITITTRARETGVCIQVTDTGPGIPPEDRQKILEPFYTTNATGTGLGLAIVKKIIDSHQGRLDVCVDERGTTFSLFFPVEQT